MTLWAVAHQAPLSMGFSRQEYWSGLLFLPPGDRPDPGIQPTSLKFPTSAGRFFTTSGTWKASVPSYHVPSHLLLSVCNFDAELFILMGVCMCVYLCVCVVAELGWGMVCEISPTGSQLDIYTWAFFVAHCPHWKCHVLSRFSCVQLFVTL